jgi:hypothetical protein
VAAANVALDPEDLALLGSLQAAGERYVDMAAVRGDTAERAVR